MTRRDDSASTTKLDPDRARGYRPRMTTRFATLRRIALGVGLLAALGCSDGDGERDDDALCGGAFGACVCGDTVVADARLDGDVVCAATHGACDVASFRCTALTLASGVTLDGAGFAVVGPPIPSAGGVVPEARRDALYGIEFPAGTHGARVTDLAVRGFVRGIVLRTALVECTSDDACIAGACAPGDDACRARAALIVRCEPPPRALADEPPGARYCTGNAVSDVRITQDAAALGDQLGLFGISIVAPDPDADDDVGGMNVIERCHVAGIGDRGIQISQARHDVVRDCVVEGSARESVHLLRGAAGNVLERNRMVRAGTGAPNLFVEDAPSNLFSGNTFVGSFVHVVGASDENRLVENLLTGEGARIDLEADVEEATGRERAPRGNQVLRGEVTRSGPASLPCVILDGATGSIFDAVTLRCGDAPPEPGEEAVQVLVARDNPDPSDPDVFHVADCTPGPDLIVRLARDVTVAPVVLEDRPCESAAAVGMVR